MNFLKVFLLAATLSLSLVYNYNFDFWIRKEYDYYQLFSVLLFTIVLFVFSKGPLKLGKVDIAVISILIFLLLSRASRLTSFNEIHILNTVSLILYYISVKTIHLRKEDFITYYNFIIGIGIFLSAYSLFELSGYIPSYNSFWNMLGNFPNPAPLGGFVAVVLLMVINELLQKEILKKHLKLVVYILIAILLLIVLIKSGSRAALLSLIVSVLILLLCKRVIEWKNLKYIIFIGLPILCFIFFYKGTDSVYGRLLIWKISFISFFENPYTGTGYGFFGVDYLNFQANYFMNGGTNQEILLAGATEQTFNEFLKFIIENGVLGILLVLGCCFWILKSNTNFHNYIKRNSSVVSFSLYSVILIFAQFSYPLQFLPFKLLLLNQIGLQKYTPLLVNFKVKVNFQKILFCLMCCLIFFASNYQYKGFRAWKEASELQFSDPDSSSALYALASSRLDHDAAFLSDYANVLKEKKTQLALVYYKKAKRLASFPGLYKKTAQLNENLGNYKSAEADYLKIHFISPHLFLPLEQLLDFYNRRGDKKKSNYYAKKILETSIKIPSAEVMRIKHKAKNQLNFH
nr:O-antigen ligase family protein [uncultured Flavobacterium sp.]